MVKDNAWANNPKDAQEIFNNISFKGKELFWIESTIADSMATITLVNSKKMIAFFD